jgi:cytochrome b
MALRTRQSVMLLPMRVWDLPTRLFHWLLVILVPACYATARLGETDLHMQLGYAVLALVLFRIAWGFVGSQTARFARFLASPAAALRHLGELRRRAPDTEIGHNPAGGWMVLLLILLLVVQVVSGLFANDGLGLSEGPLRHYVSDRTSDLLTVVHSIAMDAIWIAVALHVLAIIAYAVVKRQNLVRPMITGKKRLPAATPAPRMASPALALALLAIAALIAYLIGARA